MMPGTNEAPPPRAVVFDLDGLMFNTEDLYHEVGAEVLRRRGHAVSVELLDEMMGRPPHAALQVMIDWHGLSATTDELLRDSDEILAALLDERLAPMPGLLELLAAIESGGLPKAIATSSRRDYARRVLAPLDLESRFAFILTSEDVTQGKPHPEIYEKAARQLALSPGQMMVLEDSQNGCRAAIAAGSVAVAVKSRHNQRHDFRGAALVAESLADGRIYDVLRLSPPKNVSS